MRTFEDSTRVSERHVTGRNRLNLAAKVRIGDELRQASDATIEECVRHADAVVLRGLVYQLTGDEKLADIHIEQVAFGYSFQDRIASEDDLRLVRAQATALLRRLRDSGATEVDIGPLERLPRSLELIANAAIPQSEMEMWLEETGLDPLARGLRWKGQPTPAQKEAFQVVVIGSGISGVNAAVHLKAAGIPFVVIEKNSGVGGVWFENRYPGIRVDSPSRGYLHLFGLEYPQPYSFCPGAENVRYLEWVIDKYDLRSHFIFDTEVSDMRWDEDSATWHIAARGKDGPLTLHGNAVFTCVGFLSRPRKAQIAGLDTFRGTVTHTAEWPADLDLSGKRVAIIGTGASGYQTLPVIAKLAAHTTLFQRQPSWCYATPGYIDPLPDEVLWGERNIPFYVNFSRFRTARMYGPENSLRSQHVDPDFKDPHARSAVNKAMRDGCLAFINEVLAGHPDLIEKMTPKIPPMTSRPIRIDPKDNVYTALLRDDCDLVTDAIERVTPDGILAGGEEIPLDVIVLATGFRANDFLWPMNIEGRDGVRPETLWAKDGPRAYIGSMMPGFPNLFMAYGPNTNGFGGLQIIDLLEMEIRFAMQCVAGMIETGHRSVEVSEEAYWRFNDELDRAEKKMIYADPRVTSYYRNEHGRSSVNGPIDIRRMWRWLRDPAGPPQAETDAGIRPWFGGDLELA